MQVLAPARAKVAVEPVCYGHVAVGASVVFLGRTQEDRWLLFWGDETEGGLAGEWFDDLADAWAMFHTLTVAL